MSAIVAEPAGRIVRQTLPDGREIGYAHDRNGNLLELTPPDRPVHRFAYNAVNLTESYLPPAISSGGLGTHYDYDLDRHALDYTLDWTLGGEPFLTAPGALSAALQAAIRAETGLAAELSTTGGTSDGRFIAKICPQVVEFGPVNASIHKIDEWVEVDAIDPLKNIYRRTLEALVA